MPAKVNEREYRMITTGAMEAREADDGAKIVEGYATTFDQEYTLFGNSSYEVRESIGRNAFDEADMADVILQYDHEGRVFARKSNGTLQLSTDEHGLRIRADLGGTEIGRQLYEEIRGGYTTKMSVGMTVDRAKDVWTREERAGKIVEIRTINKVKKLYDVSAVSLPANDATSISVRTLTEGVIEKLKAERLEAEKLALAKKKTELRAKAIIAGSKK